MKEWYQKNKIKHNKEVLKSYYRDKNKWNSRRYTLELSKKGVIILNERCKCGSIKNMEIHHEEYPGKKREIIIAADKKLIYKLCRKCHSKIPKKKNNNQKNKIIHVDIMKVIN